MQTLIDHHAMVYFVMAIVGGIGSILSLWLMVRYSLRSRRSYQDMQRLLQGTSYHLDKTE